MRDNTWCWSVVTSVVVLGSWGCSSDGTSSPRNTGTAGGAYGTGGLVGATGGNVVPGGGGAPGGFPGGGGAVPAGGFPGNGGSTVVPTGGASNAGGANTGGSEPGAGGAPATGGLPGSTGGVVGTGGDASGGAGAGGGPGTGGAESGGASSTGGSVGTGGSSGSGECLCRATDPQETDLNKNGPYQYKTFLIPRGANHGGATVYYPTDAKPPFAAAAFCPPFTATQIAFSAWGPFFASHGIILATMDSVTVGDFPDQRALGLQEMVGNLKTEATRSGGPVQGKLDVNRLGIIGWSMGGGATWIASGKMPELKSAVTLAGHNLTAAGFNAAIRLSKVPTMMLNGATDVSILGGLGQSENAYALIPESTPKLLYIMADLGHFDWGTPAAENHAAGRYVMAWEKVYLENDDRYRPFFLKKGPNASTWKTNVQ